MSDACSRPFTLRPQAAIEVLDAAWLLLRRNWIVLYAASSVGTLPLALLMLGYFQWLGTVVEGTSDQVYYTRTAIWATGMALAWALNSVARTVVTAVVLADIRREPVALGDAWRRAWKHAAGSAFVGLFSFSAVWLGSACLVFPGLFLACAWWAARPAELAEERPFLAALRRSWRLTEGYRSRSLSVWLLFVLLWAVGTLNLHLLLQFLVGTAAGILGMDTSSFQGTLRFSNQVYTTSLLVAVFVVLDPLKTVADTLLYLDLRIRREGADLQERLRALRVGLAILLGVFCAAGAPRCLAQEGGGGVSVERYLARVQALRRQVERAESAGQVDSRVVSSLRDQLVRMPGGQKITVGNDWLRSALENWEESGDKSPLLARLEALERSLGGMEERAGAEPVGSAPAGADVDPKPVIQGILREPEFQPLADRPELRDLAPRLDLSKTKNWWDSFWDWVRKVLFKPPQPRVRPPEVQAPDGGILKIIFYVLLGVAVLFLLALLVRWFMERPARGDGRAAPIAAEAPPLSASATENALDHTVDEWELFARQWLGRGEVRQAIRALYLATLVHLHRERRIDYNRALTNWVYVRQFRGDTEQKGTLRQLTQMFDEVWYGERPCAEEHYRTFETGVRALGTPAPVHGAARG
jgi:uncharacterized protein DUF4129